MEFLFSAPQYYFIKVTKLSWPLSLPCSLFPQLFHSPDCLLIIYLGWTTNRKEGLNKPQPQGQEEGFKILQLAQEFKIQRSDSQFQIYSLSNLLFNIAPSCCHTLLQLNHYKHYYSKDSSMDRRADVCSRPDSLLNYHWLSPTINPAIPVSVTFPRSSKDILSFFPLAL